MNQTAGRFKAVSGGKGTGITVSRSFLPGLTETSASDGLAYVPRPRGAPVWQRIRGGGDAADARHRRRRHAYTSEVKEPTRERERERERERDSSFERRSLGIGVIPVAVLLRDLRRGLSV